MTWRTWVCLVGLWVSYFAGMFYAAGALGFFDDPARSRIRFVVISAVSFALAAFFGTAGTRWGPPRR